jgi:tRNA 5-methylaminomethyl-2-thiouridine biosynthesis bifunctional protein
MTLPWYTIPATSFTAKTAIIIGGGLAGTSAAASLAKRGWKVTLIERNVNIASEASGNPAGIISPMISHKNDLIGEFYLAGFNYTTTHYKYNKCGVLEIGKQDKDVANLVVPQEMVRVLSQNDASEICGAQLKDGGLFIEAAGWVSPAEICRSNLANENIQVVYNSEAIAIEKTGQGWCVGSIEVEVVIIANANDAKKFIQTNWLPIIPVRGQITYLPATIDTNTILCYEGGYVTPVIDGVNYVGATFNREAVGLEVSEEENRENLKNLKNVLNCHPERSGAESKDLYQLVGDPSTEAQEASAQDDSLLLKGRASFRATTPDRRPIIGAVADHTAFCHDYAELKHGRPNAKYPDGKYLSGLYVTTGHGSRGITSCPLGGELLAAMINNEELPLTQNIVDALNPARVLIKGLKRGVKL